MGSPKIARGEKAMKDGQRTHEERQGVSRGKGGLLTRPDVGRQHCKAGEEHGRKQNTRIRWTRYGRMSDYEIYPEKEKSQLLPETEWRGEATYGLGETGQVDPPIACPECGDVILVEHGDEVRCECEAMWKAGGNALYTTHDRRAQTRRVDWPSNPRHWHMENGPIRTEHFACGGIGDPKNCPACGTTLPQEQDERCRCECEHLWHRLGSCLHVSGPRPDDKGK